MAHTVATLAQQFGVESTGSAATVINGVCGLSDNRPDHLAFIVDRKHLETAAASAIPAFVTSPEQPVPGKACLLHPSPEYLIALIAREFQPPQLADMPPQHSSAVVATDAEIGAGVEIGANVVIGSGVRIGRGTRLFPNVVLMDRVVVGEDCILYPNCTVREDCHLGDRVILQPGVSIGGDGYGFVAHEGRHVKIPQLGRVVLEDDVEVGANSTIDRARFSETRIGEGTKIDNLVMLAHNVETGKHCLLVSQVGVSGSTRLGDRVVLAGQVGTVGHVTVTDDVTVLGKGGITKDIREPGIYAGMPLKPAKLWRKAMARLYAGLK